MTSLPTGRLVTGSVATPLAFSMPVPMEFPLFMNVTVPLGVPVLELTVAVSVTLAP
jgi:hypothetical protein